jgi:maltooligosyltrehalose synthase
MNYRLPEGHEVPVGSEVWNDTRLFLPAAATQATFRNVFTGARVAPDEENGVVLAADLFRSCPVALLISEPM